MSGWGRGLGTLLISVIEYVLHITHPGNSKYPKVKIQILLSVLSLSQHHKIKISQVEPPSVLSLKQCKHKTPNQSITK
jgi:hypothetical protein